MSTVTIGSMYYVAVIIQHQARIQGVGALGARAPRVKRGGEKRREGRRGEKKGREGDNVSILLQSH